MRLEAKPLIEYVEGKGGISNVLNVVEYGNIQDDQDREHRNLAKLYQRAKRDGTIEFYSADRFTCSIGLHPALIWGWDEYIHPTPDICNVCSAEFDSNIGLSNHKRMHERAAK